MAEVIQSTLCQSQPTAAFDSSKQINFAILEKISQSEQVETGEKGGWDLRLREVEADQKKANAEPDIVHTLYTPFQHVSRFIWSDPTCDLASHLVIVYEGHARRHGR